MIFPESTIIRLRQNSFLPFLSCEGMYFRDCRDGSGICKSIMLEVFRSSSEHTSSTTSLLMLCLPILWLIFFSSLCLASLKEVFTRVSVGLFLGRGVLTLPRILGLFAGKYLRIFLGLSPGHDHCAFLQEHSCVVKPSTRVSLLYIWAINSNGRAAGWVNLFELF